MQFVYYVCMYVCMYVRMIIIPSNPYKTDARRILKKKQNILNN